MEPKATSVKPEIALSHDLELRWRIQDGQIPLLARHLSSLRQWGMTPPLCAWVQQRLETAVGTLWDRDTTAVLRLAIAAGRAVTLAVEKLKPPPELTVADIQVQDGFITGLNCHGRKLDASVWLEVDERKEPAPFHENTPRPASWLVVAQPRAFQHLCGAADTLTWQLAQTLGYDVSASLQPEAQLATARALFAICDEYGFIPIQKTAVPGGLRKDVCSGALSAATAATPSAAVTPSAVAPIVLSADATPSAAATLASHLNKVFPPVPLSLSR
ncbi:MAG: hypothetical protein LBU07_04175 [Coriobacteriales bacterium]|jgi:hypothetical protein|nr:hypothetical protein [Coriobacteriales bacterium]